MNLVLSSDLPEITIDQEFKAIIPPLAEEEFKQLEENIITEGCRDAIVLWNNIIVDGHNRYKICQKHNLPYSTIDKNFPNREAVIEWMILNQLGRRNLSAANQSYLRGLQYQREKKRKEDNLKQNQSEPTRQNVVSMETAERLAQQHKVSSRTIQRDAEFTQAIDQITKNNADAKNKILAGKVNISKKDVTQIAKLEPELQDKIISKVVDGEAKSVIDAKRIIKKEENKEVAAPLGKYRVLYADPPWQYGNNLVSGYGAAVNHYPTMTIKELCELPVSQITEDNAVLFLWTTSPLLEESFAVIKAWGFKYKTSFVWDKVKHNMGHYNSVRHELLLICTKGSCLPDNKKLFDSVVEIERTNKHSEKPDEFREIIEALYTHGNKIELFSRKKVDGWEAWGNDPNVSS